MVRKAFKPEQIINKLRRMLCIAVFPVSLLYSLD